jgi:hypothetical protein
VCRRQNRIANDVIGASTRPCGRESRRHMMCHFIESNYYQHWHRRHEFK